MVNAAAQDCWTSSVYHESAWLLAKSIGPVDSDAVCVYADRKDDNLDEECSPPCQALIMAVWGDCYCRNPNYQPSTFGGHVDKTVSGKSVKEIFKLFSDVKSSSSSGGAKSITCRNWMREKENMDAVSCL